MKAVWGMSRGLATGLAALGLSAALNVAPAGAGTKPLSADAGLMVPVALTRQAPEDLDTTAPQAIPIVRTMTVSKGDTLAAMLAVAAINRRDIDAAMKTLRKRFNPRKLAIGQRLYVIVETERRGADRLIALSLELGNKSFLVVERRAGRRFVSRYLDAPLLSDTDHGATVPAEARTLRVRKGDTLTRILVREGAARDAADRAAFAIGKLFNLKRLQIGQEVTISFTKGGAALAAVALKVSRDGYVMARTNGKGGFAVSRTDEPSPEIATETIGKTAPDPLDPSPKVAEKAPAEADIEDDDSRQVYRIGKGDTLTGALVRAGVDRKPAYAASAALGALTNLRKLRVGQKIYLAFSPGGAAGKPGLAAVSIRLKSGKYIVAGRDEAGGFSAKKAASPLFPSFESASMAAATSAAAVAMEAPPLRLSALADYKSLAVRKGDTLTTALLRVGGGWGDSDAAAAALTRYVDPRALRIGLELSAVFDKLTGGGPANRLIAVSLTLSDDKYLVARRNDDDSFTAWQAATSLDGLFEAKSFAAAKEPPPPVITLAPLPEDVVQKQVDVRPGDTLMKALLKAGSDGREAEAAIAALKSEFNPRSLRAGQRLDLAFGPALEGGKPSLQRIAIGLAPGRSIEVGREAGGGFVARIVETPLERLVVHAGGSIDSSLYKAAADAGVPVPVLLELIRAFSYDVDFQREIQRGDGFEVMFERYLDETGTAVREGKIIYAALTLSGAPLRIYRHVDRDGFADYYNEDGNSVRKALLRTPIDGARLTSGYGQRKHPVLGYTKMHRGVDFGAKRGTPLMAAGDGVITFAGWNGSFGKYIRIRHRGKYSTAYAHLGGIATGIKKGRRIKQGQVIGYVGSTGRSTGPHLHYEVLVDGKQTNPLKVKLPTGAKLKGAALAAFQATRTRIETQLAALPLVSRVADAKLPGTE